MKINKKSKGYILTEVLIGSILQAVFIVSLAASVYWLTMFSVRTHYLLLAREKGQRIVAHIDSRIKNCGYGLWACQTPVNQPLTDILCDSLAYVNDGDKLPMFAKYKQAIRIFEDASVQIPVEKSSEDGNLYHSTGFAILYASTSGLIIKSNDVTPMSSGIQSISYDVVHLPDDDNNDFDIIKNSNRYRQSWGIIPAAGIPVKINELNVATNKITIEKFFPESVNVPIVGEIMYLKDELFFVNTNNNFCYRIMNEKINNGTGGGAKYNTYYGNPNSYVNDILRIYCEWYRKEKIFNLYILSSGGERPIGMDAQDIPNNWSTNDKEFYGETGLFKTEYQKYICYVTRASWKLHNIP